MNKKQWIKSRLEFHNNDINKVYKEFEDYNKEFDSKITYSSYERSVRKARGGVEKEVISPKKSPEYKEYNREDLISLIHDSIVETKKKIKMKDVSEKYTIPKGAFLKYVPDFGEVVKNIYQENMFHIKDEVKLSKATKDLTLLKKELNFYKKEEYKHNKGLDLLKEVVQHYEPFKLKSTLIKQGDRNAEAVVLLSDWHFDEFVDKAEMHGTNEYTIEIAKRRIDQVFKGIVKNSQYLQVDILNILLLGDFLSGNLHDLAENNELGLTHSILVLADYISQHIRNLTKYFKKIKGIALSGNHARYDSKFAFKKMQIDNFEYLLYEFIKRQTVDCFDLEIPQSAFLVHEINGVSMLSLHGQVLRGGSGLNNIPGNLSRDISLMGGTLAQDNIYFSVANLAHFHTFNVTKAFSGAEIIMNGSVIGSNQFSLLALKKGEKPSQTYYLVEKDYGVRFIDRIKLT